jgi:2Fe-2S ferredoxin
MRSITFLPAGATVECQDGETLFEVGRRAGVSIETACVGKATCGLCRVRVVSGEEHLNPFNEHEQRHLGNVYFLTKVRLSCQAVVTGGDITVELTPRQRSKR